MNVPIGECVLAVSNHPLGRLQERELIIERADPKVRITDELLEEIRYAQNRYLAMGVEPLATVVGDVLTLNGRDGVVIYRLTGNYDPKTCSWLAVWPD